MQPPELEIENELARIRAEYVRRGASAATAGRYSLFDGAALLQTQSLERALLALLKQFNYTQLAEKKILDVGCGGGGHLRRWLEYGARPENLAGIDLAASRIAHGRALNPAIDWRVGSAHELPYPDASFDVVTALVVFSSVLSPGVRRMIADEMWRVRKPGGLIVCYDFVYSNPRNPAVQGISRRHMRELFGRPGARFTFRALTLAPPLARQIAPHARWLADTLEQVRVLDTHMIGVINLDEAPESRARRAVASAAVWQYNGSAGQSQATCDKVGVGGKAAVHDPTTETEPPVIVAALAADAGEPWLPQDPDASREVRFVQLCARRALSSAHSVQLAELGASLSAMEWQQVLFAATAQGVVPLVFVHAARAGLLAGMPPEVAGGLGDSYRQTLVTNRGLQRDQEMVLSALAAHGVAAIALKGIGLAASCYGDIALRPIHDIDLLIRRSQVRRAGRVLQDLGYFPLRGRARSGNFVALLGADLSYANDGGVMIELHWELTHRPVYRKGLSVSDAWQRSHATELHGKPMRRLNVGDELRFLSVHCTVDHPVGSAGIRLIWLADIAELIRALPGDWDWTAFLEETIARGLAAPVAVALTHCQALLDLELPPTALETLRAAAETPEERARWRTAQTDIFSADGLWAHLSAIQGADELATFLSGILLPGPARIRKYYGHPDDSALHVAQGYARYFSRLLTRFPELFGAGRVLSLATLWRRWPRSRRAR